MNSVLFWLAIVGIYFLPAITAKLRWHNNSSSIGVLNIFLGWTFLGWVVALVWSFSDNVRTRPAR